MIAALKVTVVEKNSATLTVVKVLSGEFAPKQVTIRWTATQQPPIDAGAVGQPAVLLAPKDPDDPTLLQVSPEYLSLTPDKEKPGQFEFVRLNGFVKGSFNGRASDMIRLIEDTLAGRAYFPICADTSFAPAVKLADLPAVATALAIGDLDGEGKLAVVVATPAGVVALVGDGAGKFTTRQLKGVQATAVLQLADANGDGKADILTDAGLFINASDGQFVAAEGLSGRKWSAARFCHVPGRAGPAIAAVEAGRTKLYARLAEGKWADISAEMGLDKAPAGVLALSVTASAGQTCLALVTGETLAVLEAAQGQPFRQVQSLPLVEKGKPALVNPRLCQPDLDLFGWADVFVAHDGGASLFHGLAAAKLEEIPDYLGDVRKMLEPVAGCLGLVCEDFNNDGLADLLVCSKSHKLSLIMNRGYHNLCEGTRIFDLPEALKGLEAVGAVAATDIDGDGDLDLIVACGKDIYLLANTFEKKPEEANVRPRNPLLTVRAPGKFGATVIVEDKDGKPLASGQVGSGPVADTLYLGYRAPAPAAVTLKTVDGRTLRQPVPADNGAKAIVFKQ